MASLSGLFSLGNSEASEALAAARSLKRQQRGAGAYKKTTNALVMCRPGIDDFSCGVPSLLEEKTDVFLKSFSGCVTF